MTKEKIIGLASKSRTENKFLDFKSELDISSALSWCELIKDIIAMANSGGGVILFGIEDNGDFSNFSKNIILNLDPATITEKVSKYIDEDFTEFELIEIKRGRKNFAAIYIHGSTIPIVFSKNGVQKSDGSKFKSVFAEGTVYFRRGAKSRPGNTQCIKNSFDKSLEKIRREWSKGIRQVSELGMNDVVNVEVKKQNSAPSTLSGLVRLSAQGVPVRFTNDDVKNLKKLFPFFHKEIFTACMNKRRVSQSELQKYIDKCKKDSSLAFNWKLIGKNLEIPTSFPERFAYSPKVIENF